MPPGQLTVPAGWAPFNESIGRARNPSMGMADTPAGRFRVAVTTSDTVWPVLRTVSGRSMGAPPAISETGVLGPDASSAGGPGGAGGGGACPGGGGGSSAAGGTGAGGGGTGGGGCGAGGCGSSCAGGGGAGAAAGISGFWPPAATATAIAAATAAVDTPTPTN